MWGGDNYNFGGEIGPDENLVCKLCKEKHHRHIISVLENFWKSDKYNSIIELRKKIIWTNEEMGNWYDAANKSFIENVFDYNKYNLYELQYILINSMIDIVNILLRTEDEFVEKEDFALKNLKEKFLKEYDRLHSYINIDEYNNKIL